MRLRRAAIDGPGISRRRRGRGFSYRFGSRPITDEETLTRIRVLAVPPNWSDVWISPDQFSHIQAVGTDAAGRRQYLYHERWRARRDAEKFDRMLAFARALPELRARVDEDLARRGMPRERALACAVRLLDQAVFRVGGEAYTRENGSFGLATIRKDHVSVGRDRIVFDFNGKGGKRRIQEVRDGELIAPLRTMRRRRGGGSELLAYRDGGRWRDVRSADINRYIQETVGAEHTAKGFRTWHGTVFAAVSVAVRATDGATRRSHRRLATAAVRDVAEFLGNTPAVARASYIDPRVFDRFEEGSTIAGTLERLGTGDPADPEFRAAVESAVLELLGEPGSAARAA